MSDDGSGCVGCVSGCLGVAIVLTMVGLSFAGLIGGCWFLFEKLVGG